MLIIIEYENNKLRELITIFKKWCTKQVFLEI